MNIELMTPTERYRHFNAGLILMANEMTNCDYCKKEGFNNPIKLKQLKLNVCEYCSEELQKLKGGKL